jgi:hypothetical protein
MVGASCTIFYSWQSQLPSATNRGFIAKALEASARAVRAHATIDVRPEIDHDAAGIASIVRKKIDAADAVVCDVTIVQGLDGDGKAIRPTPNADVLIELGYAMRSPATDRLVLVMNTAFGSVDRLPFDLRRYRPATYHLGEHATTEEKSAQRKALASKLEASLRQVLSRSRDSRAGRPTSAQVAEPPLVDTISRAATRVMKRLGDDYEHAGFPDRKAWSFSLPTGDTTVGELTALGFLEPFGSSEDVEQTSWRLTASGQRWIMSHRPANS